jgi:hypothetical protein
MTFKATFVILQQNKTTLMATSFALKDCITLREKQVHWQNNYYIIHCIILFGILHPKFLGSKGFRILEYQ